MREPCNAMECRVEIALHHQIGDILSVAFQACFPSMHASKESAFLAQGTKQGKMKQVEKSSEMHFHSEGRSVER